ncbi:MAG: NAD(P)H-dependent oxidoreductase [Polyangiaceae bacterium]
MKLLGISGSLRQGSFNSALLRAAVKLAPAGIEFETFSLAEIPLYNDDVRVAGFPEPVQALRAAIARAEALLFVSPEYNFSIPGVLKNAIDWASRQPDQPFAGKPVAIMSASTGMLGGARMQYHLRQVCVFVDMHPLNKPEVFVGQASSKFDAQLELTDETTKRAIVTQLEALQRFRENLKT